MSGNPEHQTQPTMFFANRFRILPALALAGLLSLTACDNAEPSGGVTPPPPPPPTPTAPAISVGSVDVSGGYVYFSARPSSDATFQKVVVNPPPPYDTQTINLGNDFVLSTESIDIYSGDTSFGFYPYWPDADGAWSYTFTVFTGVGSGQQEHTVRVDLDL